MRFPAPKSALQSVARAEASPRLPRVGQRGARSSVPPPTPPLRVARLSAARGQAVGVVLFEVAPGIDPACPPGSLHAPAAQAQAQVPGPRPRPSGSQPTPHPHPVHQSTAVRDRGQTPSMHLVLLTYLLALGAPGSSATFAAPAAVLAPRLEKAEKVVVSTEDKIDLAGSYWAPKSKQASPGALLVHGAGGKRADLQDMAERLHKIGFAVLAIDLRGHGESATADLDWTKLEPAGQEELWSFATRDVKAGTKFLQERKEIHGASIVIVGHREGCALAARHAARDESVRGIALLDPPTGDSKLLGFQLDKELSQLGGLPTYISVPQEQKDLAQRLAQDGQRANGGLEFIRVSVFGGGSSDLLQDAREAAEACKWLKERGFPNKARAPSR
jgi:dienelactone hydrolase